jgi:hypothetical protein
MVYYWVVIILEISASIFTYSIDYTFVSGCFVGAGSVAAINLWIDWMASRVREPCQW